MDRVNLFARRSEGNLNQPSFLREFGGNGNCGPASLAGVMNFFGITTDDIHGERFHGGHSRLRQLIVQRLRTNQVLLDELSDTFAHLFTIGFEVRGSNGSLIMIHSMMDYLGLMVNDGFHFDEISWQITARVLNIQIVIYRVR